MKRLVALVPLAVMLSACGVFGGDEAVETTVPSPTVPSSSTLPPTSTTDARRVTETAEEVFAALAAGDAASLASVVPLVTPGSPAAVLVAHQETVASLVAELVLPEATTTTSVVPVEASSSTSSTSTPQPAAVVTPDVRFSDPIFDDDGLVRSFLVNGTPVGALVREAGPVAVADGVQGRVASAYRTVAGRVSVLIDVTAAEEDLTVFGFAAVHRARTIDPGSSGLTEATGAWGVDTVPAGASTRLLVVFDDGELDGEILLTVLTDSGLDIGLVLSLIAP